MVAGNPVMGSLRSTISSPTIRPGRAIPVGREKLARRTATSPLASAERRLVRVPVFGGVPGGEGANDLDRPEEDGGDADEDDERGQRCTRMPEAKEADGDDDDAADEVGPPIGQEMVADRIDDVEDAQHQEGPPDKHGDDEDGDVGPHEP